MFSRKKETHTLQKTQRGLVFEKGVYQRLLMPGEHTLEEQQTLSVFSVVEKFASPIPYLEISEDKTLLEQLIVLEIADHEIVIHKEGGQFVEVLTAGRHFFWKSALKRDFIRVDLNKAEIDGAFDRQLLNQKALHPYLSIYNIPVSHVGILSVGNAVQKILEPGTYAYWKNPATIGNLVQPLYEVEVVNTVLPFTPLKELNYYLTYAPLVQELDVIDVLDHQLVLHLEEGKLKKVLRAGRYAFWKRSIKNTFIFADTNKSEVDPTIDESLLTNPMVLEHGWYFFVEAHEKGLLILDKNFERVLEPGAYRFWKSPVSPAVIKIDMRIQQLEVNGQEIMTRDKVTLRINFVCQFKISDPVKAGLEIKDYQAQLYVVLQLALREYLGSQSLDEVLDKKEAISSFIAEKVKTQAADLGLEITWSGIKDVILPGEVKDILNQVLIAERKAQANVITRREETASTRSLLNTAKLMEENETLYKLKELEYIERISEKINQISLGGGSQMLEQLRDILMPKK